MANLRVQEPGSKYCHFPKRDDYGSAYFKSLLSEANVYDPKTKKYVWKKIPGHERNEALDCRNYANAAEKTLSPDYDALQQKLTGASAVPTSSSVPKSTHKKTPKRKQNHFDDW